MVVTAWKRKSTKICFLSGKFRTMKTWKVCWNILRCAVRRFAGADSGGRLFPARCSAPRRSPPLLPLASCTWAFPGASAIRTGFPPAKRHLPPPRRNFPAVPSRVANAFFPFGFHHWHFCWQHCRRSPIFAIAASSPRSA
uniref:(northern house mosquito) hypothetical protein n=1 Tax=Culex pipiens TaxID=7175 RepID=A0A8D8AY15_CULPI